MGTGPNRRTWRPPCFDAPGDGLRRQVPLCACAGTPRTAIVRCRGIRVPSPEMAANGVARTLFGAPQSALSPAPTSDLTLSEGAL